MRIDCNRPEHRYSRSGTPPPCREAPETSIAHIHRAIERGEKPTAHRAEMAASLDTTQTVVQKLVGTILLRSSGAESSYGWRRAGAVGCNAVSCWHRNSRGPRRKFRTGEYRKRRRDGSVIWVASSWTLHRNDRGEPGSVVGVNSDTTALKHTSEARRELRARRRLCRFLKTPAREFQPPLKPEM
jgi:PAS domain S-box-containing protein